MKTEFRAGRILRVLVLVTVCAAIPLCSLNAQAAPNARITVNSTSNKIKGGDGLCTLREAIKNANTDSDTTKGDCVRGNGDDTIVLGKKQTYTLASADHTMPDGSGNGLPMITSNITLQGNGSTIQRRTTAPKFRLMWVDGGATLHVFKTNFKYGDVSPDFMGGAMFLNNVTVDLHNTRFENNAAMQGGAIWNGESALSVYDSYFGTNSADIGGAVRSEQGGVIPETQIFRSTFENNIATSQAGAVYDHGELMVAYSTFTQNNGGSL